jgi:hypothetical protein
LSLIATLLPMAIAMAEDRGSGERMADAMTRMMEAFGFTDAEDAAPMSPGIPSPQSPSGPMADVMPDWSGVMPPGAPAAATWPGRFGDPMWEFGLPKPFNRFSEAMGEWRPTPLDGLWEGRDGGLLIVRGYRFRLYQPNAGYIDGMIQQRGDRIALYNPATDSARPYDFALHRGRLVLRDAEGSIFLYRRLWMEEEGPNDPFKQSPPTADAPK